MTEATNGGKSAENCCETGTPLTISEISQAHLYAAAVKLT